MPLEDVGLPESSLVQRDIVARATYVEAYRVRLTNPQASVTELFFAVFGHRPVWMKALFIARNVLVRPLGLAVPPVAQILSNARRERYCAGDTILSWPIFALTETELVAGRNNAHLDFRFSILKEQHGDGVDGVFSTVCAAHHWGGRLYLKAILPFHRPGFRWLLRRAILTGRL